MKAEMGTSTDSTLENKKVAKILFGTLAGPLKSKSYSSYQLLAQLDNYNNTLSKELFDMLLNEQDENGNTLLHLAVEQGDFTVFPALMKRKANLDLNIKNTVGETALSLAIKKGRSYDARDIIVAGADLNIQYENGNTALHLAVEQGDFTVFPALMKRKADIDLNIKNDNGKTPLDLAIEQKNFDFVYKLIKNDSKQLEEFLASRSNIDLRDNFGDTMLHYAATSKDKELLEKLIKAGNNINIQNKLGYTPLHFAVSTGYLDITQELIRAGSNINIQDKEGNTPLIIAMKNNSHDIVEELIQNPKIDLNLSNKLGESPLKIAFESENKDLVRKLIQKGVKFNKDVLPKRLNNDDKLVAFFKEAIKEGNSELVKVLATEFKDKLKGKYLTMVTGRTLHSYALAKGKTEIAADLEIMGFKKQ